MKPCLLFRHCVWLYTPLLSMEKSDSSLCSIASSEALNLEKHSLSDLDAASSCVSSCSSTTTVCWIPGGLPGKVLQAFGTSTIDLVKQLAIKKRLSSISSQIELQVRL